MLSRNYAHLNPWRCHNILALQVLESILECWGNLLPWGNLLNKEVTPPWLVLWQSVVLGDYSELESPLNRAFLCLEPPVLALRLYMYMYVSIWQMIFNFLYDNILLLLQALFFTRILPLILPCKNVVHFTLITAHCHWSLSGCHWSSLARAMAMKSGHGQLVWVAAFTNTYVSYISMIFALDSLSCLLQT